MGKGLLAHWRRGLARRGLAGIVLLAVPVTVAAAIGFSGGFGALTELPAFAIGREGEIPEAPTVPSPELDLLSTAPGAAAGPGDDRRGRDGVRSEQVGGDGPVTGGDQSASSGETGNSPGGLAPGTGNLGLPVQDPSGTLDDLVDNINQGVDGLVGGLGGS